MLARLVTSSPVCALSGFAKPGELESIHEVGSSRIGADVLRRSRPWLRRLSPVTASHKLASLGVELRGPTLTLRYATSEDAPALFELGRDREVTRFFSWGPYAHVDEPRAYVGMLAGQRERGEQLDLLIVHRVDGPIGVIGLSEWARRDRRAIVGTWLGRPWWGSGANLEAKALLAHLAFAHLGLERLGAYADLENDRSQRALARLGFVREGVLRHWHRHGAEVHDVVVFGLLRADWVRSPLAAVPTTLQGAPPAAFRCAAAPS
jgi:ribosomal-protein-alanine N-acetyltransferase